MGIFKNGCLDHGLKIGEEKNIERITVYKETKRNVNKIMKALEWRFNLV